MKTAVDGRQWFIFRRYTDFCRLHEMVQSNVYYITDYSILHSMIYIMHHRLAPSKFVFYFKIDLLNTSWNIKRKMTNVILVELCTSYWLVCTLRSEANLRSQLML